MGDSDAGQQSGKTKYGRVPLWLYEAGVSLQAVATYGWIHGRYGHFDRITPSYGTLAKELGVSRGSVIAYVKELQAVGAVRIVQSGAQGRQSNEFAIAFDAPFARESTGQNADRSAGRPVSGLYSGGQPADPGGQPAVQEEDSSFQTKKTLSSRFPQQATEPPAAQGEREIDPLIQKLMTDHDATEDEATAVIAQVRAEGKLENLAGWACSATGAFDIKQRLYSLRHGHDVPTVAGPSLPAWCTRCGDGNPAAEHNPKFRIQAGVPCPACHPDALKDAAA